MVFVSAVAPGVVAVVVVGAVLFSWRRRYSSCISLPCRQRICRVVKVFSND